LNGINLGNVQQESLHSIWNSNSYYKLLQRLLESGYKGVLECKDCKYPLYCCFDNIDSYKDVILTKIQDAYLRSERKNESGI
jgi:radical SAM protein with 4Fe4S-binding SPASM domain